MPKYISRRKGTDGKWQYVYAKSEKGDGLNLPSKKEILRMPLPKLNSFIEHLERKSPKDAEKVYNMAIDRTDFSSRSEGKGAKGKHAGVLIPINGGKDGYKDATVVSGEEFAALSSHQQDQILSKLQTKGMRSLHKKLSKFK